jgi:hypothetical protein
MGAYSSATTSNSSSSLDSSDVGSCSRFFAARRSAFAAARATAFAPLASRLTAALAALSFAFCAAGLALAATFAATFGRNLALAPSRP